MRPLCLCVLLALGACRSVPERDVPAPSTAEREAVLAARTDWGFSGRVAYSQAGQGGSARIDWRQTGPVSEVRLSGPLAAGDLLAEGEADAVFAHWLSVPLPARDLTAGLRAYWPDSPERTAAALSGSVRSQSWDWRYSAWWPDPVDLPRQLEVQAGDARLRVVIEQWREGGGD